MLPELLGGVGIFLLGMILLTDGLKALAGGKLREILVRFTGRPVTAMASGAGLTAIVQSSSATTLATIGLVSGGLLTFEQSIGVILGANIGTTSTGWIVALLGLKFSLSTVALPLVGVGALLRLLGRGRWEPAGLAVAGFGLIFVGIDLMQVGMEGLAGSLDPVAWAGGGLLARLLLVGVGIVATVLVQSSSAAMAATLAAVAAGALDLESGALLIIGQNIGTTVTAVLGAIGASVAARRTAAVHVVFNVTTGLVAFLTLPLFLWAVGQGAAALGESEPAAVLALFHTSFNVVGVALFFPLITPLARTTERLIPDKGPRLGRSLGPLVAQVPGVAIEAARSTLAEVGGELTQLLQARMERSTERREAQDRLVACQDALARTRAFLGKLRAGPGTDLEAVRYAATIHALDHLEAVAGALGHPPPLADHRQDATYARFATEARAALEAVDAWLQTPSPRPSPAEASEDLGALQGHRQRARREAIGRSTEGALPLEEALAMLEAVAWLAEQGQHLSRVVRYLADPPPEDSLEVERAPLAGDEAVG